LRWQSAAGRRNCPFTQAGLPFSDSRRRGIFQPRLWNHWEGLDDLWIQRPWDELDLESYGERVKQVLDEGGLWISGSDLEAMWLADLFPNGHKNLLAPPMAALKRITKPAVEGASGLPVEIPTFISTDHSDWDLHAFCRAHNWRVWLKGPYYDAARTPTWDSFAAARSALSKVWSTERLYLQAHVSGYEESVMLSAYKGELLGAVSMRKREITPEGKTWAGRHFGSAGRFPGASPPDGEGARLDRRRRARNGPRCQGPIVAARDEPAFPGLGAWFDHRRAQSSRLAGAGRDRGRAEAGHSLMVRSSPASCSKCRCAPIIRCRRCPSRSRARSAIR
jgi:hypothetical protein